MKPPKRKRAPKCRCGHTKGWHKPRCKRRIMHPHAFGWYLRCECAEFVERKRHA
jgi:hypothetical protein